MEHRGYTPPEAIMPPVEPEKEPQKKPHTVLGAFSRIRREIGAVGTAIALTIAAGSDADARKSPHQEEVSQKLEEEKSPETSFFNDDPAWFKEYPRGEFSEEERRKRREILPNGEVILHDVGLDFYYVQPGDSIAKIRSRLARYPQYAYLAKQRGDLQSFNGVEGCSGRGKKRRCWNDVQPGMILPIPTEKTDRNVGPEQMVDDIREAIRQMKVHPRYGAEVTQELARIGEDEMVAILLSIAKQESSLRDLPLGGIELQRWEHHIKAFSTSFWHVLMKWDGLTARQNLNMTEGQTYHPVNGAKLVLAYMCQKPGVFQTLPLYPGSNKDKNNVKKFAKTYNGSAAYGPKLAKYYPEAKRIVSDLKKDGDLDLDPRYFVKIEEIAQNDTVRPQPKEVAPTITPTQKTPVRGPAVEKKAPAVSAKQTTSETVVRIKRGDDLRSMIHRIDDQRAKKNKLPQLLTAQQEHLAAQRVAAYLKKFYGSKRYYTTDLIGVDKDAQGVKIIFIRNNKRATLRIN
jgi:hypothetical protein